MFNFSNQRPVKQGTKYGLSLGQNDGPYLPKDTMMANQRSAQMLAASNMKNSASAYSVQVSNHNSGQFARDMSNHNLPKVYDQHIGTYTDYDEKNKTVLTASEGLGTNSKFNSEEMRKMKESLQEYKELVTQYKDELKGMNRNINEANQNNLGEIQPAMRSFYDSLKSMLQDTKNYNYQLQREVEQLNRDRTQIQQQISFSERRIMELEKYMGVSAKLDESDISETLDFQ